jgi:hypothetical protein
MQELSALIKMFDGEPSEKHTLEVNLDDIRKWHAEIERLRTALIKLSNEVRGSLPLLEPLMRREMGNTNYNILMQRAEEARTLIRGADVEAKPDAS